MIRFTFKDTCPLPFRQWDIEGGKIVRCEPDPRASWVGVAVPISEDDLFAATLNIRIAWTDGDYTALPLEHVTRFLTKSA